MRILQLGMGWFPEQAGGLNRYFYNLVRELGQCGDEVTAQLAATNPQSLETIDVQGFSPLDAPLPMRLLRARRSATPLVPAADVVVSHFAPYTLPLLDRCRTRPFLVHFHGPWAAESSVEGHRSAALMAKKLMELSVYRAADRIIVLSQAFAELLARHYGVAESRIEVIRGGVESQRFNVASSPAEARRLLGWPQGRPILLALRRLVRRMGLETLIEATAQLKKRHPDILLVVGGRGPLAEALAAQVARLGLTDNVTFAGYVADESLPLAYRAADLSVVPSLALEGFGLITLESLAAGTPALVTPVGGLPEAVRELSPDLVFAGTQADVIADHIGQVLDGKIKLPDADACYRYVRDRFDWPIVAREIRQTYENQIR